MNANIEQLRAENEAAQAELQAELEKQNDLSARSIALPREINHLVVELQDAEKSKQGALTSYARGEITEDQLNVVRGEYEAAKKQIDDKGEILRAIETELRSSGTRVARLSDAAIRAENRMWRGISEIEAQKINIPADTVQAIHRAFVALRHAREVITFEALLKRLIKNPSMDEKQQIRKKLEKEYI